MNWPEHLRVIHRMTGKSYFEFASGEDEPDVMLDGAGRWKYWLSVEDYKPEMLSDGELDRRLRLWDDIELVRAS